MLSKIKRSTIKDAGSFNFVVVVLDAMNVKMKVDRVMNKAFTGKGLEKRETIKLS